MGRAAALRFAAESATMTKTLAVEEVAKFDRCASGIASEEIGLSLQEGKDVLKQVQRNIVQTQIRVQSAASSCCRRVTESGGCAMQRPSPRDSA